MNFYYSKLAMKLEERLPECERDLESLHQSEFLTSRKYKLCLDLVHAKEKEVELLERDIQLLHKSLQDGNLRDELTEDEIVTARGKLVQLEEVFNKKVIGSFAMWKRGDACACQWER